MIQQYRCLFQFESLKIHIFDILSFNWHARNLIVQIIIKITTNLNSVEAFKPRKESTRESKRCSRDPERRQNMLPVSPERFKEMLIGITPSGNQMKSHWTAPRRVLYNTSRARKSMIVAYAVALKLLFHIYFIYNATWVIQNRTFHVKAYKPNTFLNHYKWTLFFLYQYMYWNVKKARLVGDEGGAAILQLPRAAYCLYPPLPMRITSSKFAEINKINKALFVGCNAGCKGATFIFVKLWMSVAKTLDMIQQVFAKKMTRSYKISEWLKRFREGCISLRTILITLGGLLA